MSYASLHHSHHHFHLSFLESLEDKLVHLVDIVKRASTASREFERLNSMSERQLNRSGFDHEHFPELFVAGFLRD